MTRKTDRGGGYFLSSIFSFLLVGRFFRQHSFDTFNPHTFNKTIASFANDDVAGTFPLRRFCVFEAIASRFCQRSDSCLYVR